MYEMVKELIDKKIKTNKPMIIVVLNLSQDKYKTSDYKIFRRKYLNCGLDTIFFNMTPKTMFCEI